MRLANSSRNAFISARLRVAAVACPKAPAGVMLWLSFWAWLLLSSMLSPATVFLALVFLALAFLALAFLALVSLVDDPARDAVASVADWLLALSTELLAEADPPLRLVLVVP